MNEGPPSRIGWAMRGRFSQLLTLLMALGCAHAPSASGPGTEPAVLEAAEQRKLDPTLARIAREGDEGTRVPVRVEFAVMPSRETLSELLLVRQGDRAVGQVTPSQLRRIARRPEVRAVRYLDGVGYSEGSPGS